MYRYAYPSLPPYPRIGQIRPLPQPGLEVVRPCPVGYRQGRISVGEDGTPVWECVRDLGVLLPEVSQGESPFARPDTPTTPATPAERAAERGRAEQDQGAPTGPRTLPGGAPGTVPTGTGPGGAQETPSLAFQLGTLALVTAPFWLAVLFVRPGRGREWR